MTFIKNERAWKRWASEWKHQDPKFLPPNEYPCYAYTSVLSYGYEEDQEHYLYRDDIDKMLHQLSKP